LLLQIPHEDKKEKRRKKDGGDGRSPRTTNKKNDPTLQQLFWNEQGGYNVSS